MKYTFLIFISILLASCAPSLTRFEYKQPLVNKNLSDCKIQINIEDATLKNIKPIARGRFKDDGFTNGCREI
jgi:hypothetical protein